MLFFEEGRRWQNGFVLTVFLKDCMIKSDEAIRLQLQRWVAKAVGLNQIKKMFYSNLFQRKA